MSDDQVLIKRKESKRPMTSEENRIDTNYFKKGNTAAVQNRPMSPEISANNKNYLSKEKNSQQRPSSKDKRKEVSPDLNPSSNIIEKETDERLRYLLKYGKIKKFEHDFRAIFAELPQIPNVWIFYRKQELRNLKPDKLEFEGYKLNHVPLLEGEEAIAKLTLSNNDIQKIENLVSQPLLTELNISHNLLKNISGLDGVGQVHIIDLSYNLIESISGLSVQEKLEEVNFSHNKIKTLEGLCENKNLMVINLSYNNIRNLNFVNSKMSQVLKLSLKKNLLNELVGIENFPNLKFLKLSRNELSQYGEIQRLNKLKNQKGLSLYKNPIEVDENYTEKILQICPFLESLDHNEVTPSTGITSTDKPIVQAVEIKSDSLAENSAKKKLTSDDNIDSGKKEKKKHYDIKANNIAGFAELEKIQNKLKIIGDTGNGNVVKKDINRLEILDKENVKGPIGDQNDLVIKSENNDQNNKKSLKISTNYDDSENLPSEVIKNQPVKNEKQTPMERIKDLFKNYCNSVSLTTQNSKDKEIWQGTKDHPAGFVKTMNTGGLRIVGDGIFAFMQSISNYKNIEEIQFDHILINNLKTKECQTALGSLKKVKSLKLNFNNIMDYLELVKFECFENLVNLIIENNPICCCTYLRQFVVYRFNNLRYFNKCAIDYQDQQKAKQVFNNFDKILQLPSQTQGKKKDNNLNSRQVYQISKVIADNVQQSSFNITKVKGQFNGLWNEVCENLLQQSYTASSIMETLTF